MLIFYISPHLETTKLNIIILKKKTKKKNQNKTKQENPNPKSPEIHDLAGTGSLLLSRVLSRIRKQIVLLTGDWKRDLSFFPSEDNNLHLKYCG